jgi:transcriptional regulator with PAS, ATPase and Fis domain
MDEIGELDPKLQGKLLRALETGTFSASAGRRRSR